MISVDMILQGPLRHEATGYIAFPALYFPELDLLHILLLCWKCKWASKAHFLIYFTVLSPLPSPCTLILIYTLLPI